MKPKMLFGVLAASLNFHTTCLADTFYWDGDNLGDWNVSTNWSTDPAGSNNPVSGDFPNDPVDIAIFNASTVTGARTINVKGNWEVASLQFNGSSTVTLQGGGANQILRIGAGGITAGAATNTVNIGSASSNQNLAISLMGSQTWAFNSSAASPQGGWGIYVRNNISLGVAGTNTLTLAGTINSTNPLSNISGDISNGLGTLNIEMSGSSNLRWTLSGNNSYTGTTLVKTGALTVGHINGLGSTSAGTTVQDGASVFMRSGLGSIAAEPISIVGQGSGSSGALRNVNGTNIWNGKVTLTGSAYIGADNSATSILTLSETATVERIGSGTPYVATLMGGGTINVNGGITGDISVVRGTTGTTVMTGLDKAYTGTTTINASGNLIVNTSLSGTSGVTVNGTLRGNGGSIKNTAAVTVSGTGSIALGTSTTIQDIGSLSMGALTLQSLATMAVDINSGNLSNDTLTVTSLTLTNGAILAVNDLGSSTLMIGEALLFIKNSGSWNGGFFTVNGTQILNESTAFKAGENWYQIDYNYDDILGKGVALVVVPEPAVPMLGGLALLALANRRRR
jgi:autotransporter-associated beta strand protein